MASGLRTSQPVKKGEDGYGNTDSRVEPFAWCSMAGETPPPGRCHVSTAGGRDVVPVRPAGPFCQQRAICQDVLRLILHRWLCGGAWLGRAHGPATLSGQRL